MDLMSKKLEERTVSTIKSLRFAVSLQKHAMLLYQILFPAPSEVFDYLFGMLPIK